MTRRRSDARVFFPWERRRGLFGALGRTRLRLVVAVVFVLSAIVFVHLREEHAAAVRATRAALSTAERAVFAYRADHAGECPRGLSEVVKGGYVAEMPIDAWGRPLRLTCPGRRDPLGFDVSSDGPDGEPGGLDRVE
jgi:general secretion pathway protein G